MTKYIDADIFVTHCCNSCIKNGVSCCPTVDSCDYIEDLQAFLVDAPAADVEPVVRGEWKRLDETEAFFNVNYGCTNCDIEVSISGVLTPIGEGYKRCPNCGAHMSMERSGSGE